MTLRGTPYIYQGQEISMGNVKFESIDEMNDIQAVNNYKENVAKGKNKEKVDAKVRAVYQRVYSSFGTQRTVLYVNYTYEYKGISYAHWCTIPDNSCRQSFAKAQRNNDPSIKGETTYFSALQSLTLTMSIDPSAPSFHKVAKEQPSFFAKQISKNLVKARKSEYELSYAGAF